MEPGEDHRMEVSARSADDTASIPSFRKRWRARLPWLRNIMRRLFGNLAICLVLLAVICITECNARRYGDKLQTVLPVLALGCEFANGRALDYLGRYVVMFAGVHITKRALGDAPLNARPNGGTHGFPSGHTATASFGASALVTRCIGRNAVVQSLVILGAAFTGASRIDANAHTIWQVLVGGVWGLLCDQCFRRGSASRCRLRRLTGWFRGLFRKDASLQAPGAPIPVPGTAQQLPVCEYCGQASNRPP